MQEKEYELGEDAENQEEDEVENEDGKPRTK